jgi:prevent-host-death family protein
MHITLTELRRTPGPALDHVRAGEEVVITEAGVPLCRMVPVGKTSRYDELVASGVLRLPVERRSPREIRAKSLELMGITEE